MLDAFEFWRKPEAEEITMIAGWRQWADAGSVSSGLPQYLADKTRARKIGQIRPDGFYIFQIPGMYDLMRPVVEFNQGYPETLQTPLNDFYYTGNDRRGVVIFIGDEPHLDIERYIATLLDAARILGVKRIIGLGGVYGEVPYDKERAISGNYSMPHLKPELEELSVNLSDYHGGASIGSYLCRRAGDRDMEYIGLYALVPAYNLSLAAAVDAGSTVRVENDFTAWDGIVRRLNYMLKTSFDLSELESKSRLLTRAIEKKVAELEEMHPNLGMRAYLRQLSEEFHEMPFEPLDDVWEENLRPLLNKLDAEDPTDAEKGEDDDLANS